MSGARSRAAAGIPTPAIPVHADLKYIAAGFGVHPEICAPVLRRHSGDISFNQAEALDYADFAYPSFTIGMTF